MALRVLLADESSTIKKVMLLALQDFAVEVKAVHVGVDVLEVARSFKPDIIFVDVLLQKRNGYEVCADLKADATTRHTPTVLMWSSFMELDQEQLAKAQPNDKIEKPFDVETLRKMVLALVPETRSQRLAHFLDFPESANEALRNESSPRQNAQPVTEKVPTRTSIPLPPPTPNTRGSIAMPGATDSPPATSQSRTAIPLPPPVSQSRTGIPIPPPAVPKAPEKTRDKTPEKTPEKTAESKPAWNMDAFEDINEFASSNLGSEQGNDDEDFAPMNLSQVTPQPIEAPADASELTLEPSSEPPEEAWAHQDLSRFKIDLPPLSVDSEGLDLKIEMGEEEFTASGFLYKPEARRQAERDDSLEERIERAEPGERTLELEASQDDLTQPILEIPEATAQIGLSLEREELPEPLEPMIPDFRDPARDRGADIPQLSADRIEEIIRAQSREIIEDVVRRIVPDIATELIREELERLLEESSVRDTRRREPRP